MNKMIDKYVIVTDKPILLAGVDSDIRIPSKKLYDEIMRSDSRQFVAVVTRKGVSPRALVSDDGELERDKILPYGVLIEMQPLEGGASRTRARGLCTVRVDEIYAAKISMRVHARIREFEGLLAPELETLRKSIMESLGKLKWLEQSVVGDADALPDDPIGFVNAIAMQMRRMDWESYLEINNLPQLYERVHKELTETCERATIRKELEKKVAERINRNQREYYLREEMKTIREELGEDDEAETLREQIRALDLSDDVREKLNKEVDRLARMSFTLPEYTMLRNYMDWVLTLPWGNYTEDCYDLARIRAVLDEDHYGIEDVKDRIVEFMAVKRLTGKAGKAPILCLVGPPGVGKTSIAQSVACSLGKEYVHISLGGIRDEAEIRGHRKTYIGAIPGRIMSGMSKVKTANPLFLLDEIDKMTSDMRGNPSAALLEVLDPNQNAFFRDSYLEVPFDLSQVLFVTTANSLATMDKALLDRLEVIEMSSYTRQEKCEIATRYLVPKQLRANGIAEIGLEIGEDVLYDLIDRYTREAGVRELERQIGSLCRKIAAEYVRSVDAGQEFDLRRIDATASRSLLGEPKYDAQEDVSGGEIGAVNGLAYTSAGGVVMPIEARFLADGKGETILTGSLGDVMKESARIALSVVRAHAERLGLSDAYFREHDLHLHVPAGATPKDGPSAGIAIASAILSAATGARTQTGIAMTGELTLRGKVMPIGGLKEKALAAHRVGIGRILYPKGNEKDLCEIPQSVREQMEWSAVSDIGEVFRSVCGVEL